MFYPSLRWSPALSVSSFTLTHYSAGDATHVRGDKFGPRQRKRARAVTSPGPGVGCGVGGEASSDGELRSPHSEGRGTGSHALSRDQKGRDTDGPLGKQARGPTATHRTAVPRRLRRRTAQSTPRASYDPAPPPWLACHRPTVCSRGAPATYLLGLSAADRSSSSPTQRLTSWGRALQRSSLARVRHRHRHRL